MLEISGLLELKWFDSPGTSPAPCPTRVEWLISKGLLTYTRFLYIVHHFITLVTNDSSYQPGTLDSMYISNLIIRGLDSGLVQIRTIYKHARAHTMIGGAKSGADSIQYPIRSKRKGR